MVNMTTSCGVIILNEYNEMFMGHSTGNKFHDLPKGMLDEGENELDCAIRECLEETSIDLSSRSLKDIGLFKYNSAKNLHLFVVSIKKEDIKLEELVCNSFFENPYTKKQQPEVDGFKWVPLAETTEHSCKSMGVLLNKLKKDNLLSYKESASKPKP